MMLLIKSGINLSELPLSKWKKEIIVKDPEDSAITFNNTKMG